MEQKPIAVVTGASGFVGSHLAEKLIQEGYHVKCIIRKSSNLRWIKDLPVEIIDCGLYDVSRLQQVFESAQYIYHVAGVVKAKKPEGYTAGNVESTRCILEAALSAKDTLKRIVIVSSQTACGPSPGETLIDENFPCNPISNYGRSKKSQEILAASYFDRLPITVCRPPAVYGERDTEIFIFFNTYAKGLTTTIGFDRKVVSLIHVADLVNGLYLAAISSNSQSQTYFITSEEIYTWEEIIDVTAKVLGRRAFRVKVPHPIVYTIAAVAQFISYFQKQAATLNIEKARDITRHAWVCSAEKAKRDLGYKQQISLEEGIRRTIGWYKSMKWI
ncbi:MAG: GDP-mannose 4,6-dehydratase [Ignavibacteria bacterium]|nr:GDP-mannose 4,6-dehydratase [Ignavibacteria bacterium]